MYNKKINPLKGLKNGYIQFRDNSHPLSYKSDGSVYLHRHLASIKVGRWIDGDEHVHHIDGNKLNNDLSNLEVLTNSEHAKLHNPYLADNIECEYCSRLFRPECSRIKFCSPQCSSLSTVKDKAITKEMLDALIPFNSWVSLSKIFGYSDNGIKKRAKALGCDLRKINTKK